MFINYIFTDDGKAYHFEHPELLDMSYGLYLCPLCGTNLENKKHKVLIRDDKGIIVISTEARICEEGHINLVITDPHVSLEDLGEIE